MFGLSPFIAQPPPVDPRWSLISSPTDLAIDLDTVKTFINRPLEDTFWDAETTKFIKIATSALETHLRIDLVEKQWRGDLPYFYPQMRLNKRPFQQVDSVEYVDPDTGEITTVASTVYHALPISQHCGMLFLGDGQSWPDIAKRWDAVRITLTSGFAEDTLPDDIEQALLMTVASLDNARGDSAQSSSNVSVYAMKQAQGRSVIPVEARALVDNWKLQLLSVA